MRSLAFLPLFTAAAVAGLANKGVDWSSLLVEEAAGKTYKNAAGTIQPLETILKANGVNSATGIPTSPTTSILLNAPKPQA
jgi:arabinogalactan endo-1,4-beta-galactosidase